MVIIQRKWFSLKEVADNPKNLYIFGDNYQRIGSGGQAIIRPAKNTAGIITKINPGRSLNTDYFKDEFIVTNTSLIEKDIKKILELSKYYENIILPYDGFGSGLSKLPELAPKTYIGLGELLKKYFKVGTSEAGKLYLL